ncbi:hypothetical protein COY14_03660 [Candidatus Roizmanbacteria bacterium CG_4_10_14_0_2_um_filter_36_9]|uniref:tetrahydrofolate synthase n=1 Tax=Candidatus Roizmanbacteria bacterium CG_4_10_14_0_2_um_filter_36_9 TaxID=1974823 RepID=A0A2M7U3A3_9BACT|nr:MAG: hypothetical protein COY14_03660 [Candidatus Roizmanbacteria bacterium CG_4_10_14_0_2_um_filter_36_9]
MAFTTLNRIQEYLYSFRDENNHFSQGKSGFSFERVRRLANRLGDPQNKIKVIHIAGTSGKGSTSQIIDQILNTLGFKTGLTVSPHLIDFRERIQISGQLVSIDILAKHLIVIKPILESLRESELGRPTYFEVMIMLAYYIFWKEKVDYAVIETGMGGRFDATNVATQEDKIAVLTKIGLDHTEFLGKTLVKIAGEKVEIIHSNNLVISINQESKVSKVILSKVAKSGSKYIGLNPKSSINFVSNVKSFSSFDIKYSSLNITKIKTPLLGNFQAENILLAVATVFELSKRASFIMDERAMRRAFSNLLVPGRLEVFKKKDKVMIIDGAHNPQKMEAFVSSLKEIYPNHKFDFMIAFKKGKDYEKMLTIILPVAKKIFITKFISDEPRIIEAEPIDEIVTKVRTLNCKVEIIKIDDPLIALELAGKSKNQILIVTGSLYLIAQLYRKIRDKMTN